MNVLMALVLLVVLGANLRSWRKKSTGSTTSTAPTVSEGEASS